MTVVLYILFKKDQNKTDLDKERTEQQIRKLKDISQRLEDSFNSIKNLHKVPIWNPERQVRLNPQRLKEITEQQPVQMLNKKAPAVNHIGQMGYYINIVKDQLPDEVYLLNQNYRFCSMSPQSNVTLQLMCFILQTLEIFFLNVHNTIESHSEVQSGFRLGF